MRILMLSPAFAPYSGVGAARMTSLAEYLVSKSCKLTVVVYDREYFNGDCFERKIPLEINIVSVKVDGNIIHNLKKTLMNVMEKSHYDICISSVGPYESMYVIRNIMQKYHTKYIIDYRDMWIFSGTECEQLTFIQKLKRTMMDYINLFFERKAVKGAIAFVAVTDNNRKELVKRYPKWKGKFKTIFNGYEDLPNKQETEHDEKTYKIGIAGKMSYYNPKMTEEIFSVLSRFNKNGKRVVLEHIGNEDKITDKLLEKYGNRSMFYKNYGEMSHPNTMLKMMEMDALLVVNAHRSGFGTKVFDYIALNKPIIYAGVCLSELSKFVEQFEEGMVCGDEIEFGQVLCSLLDRRPKTLTTEDTTIYSREVQNEIYYKLICECVS